jgi:putative intracellular protease/amidase
MQSTPSTARTQRGLVLVADGFDEQTAICCIRAFRDAGIAVALVGLPAGLVTGNRGISLHPDLSLDEVQPDVTSTLVVIPGGRRSAASLLTDPRVHQIVEATAAGGGKIAVLGTAVEGAERLLRVPLCLQGDLTNREFLAQLVQEGC